MIQGTRAVPSSAPGGEGSPPRTLGLGLVQGWQPWMTAFGVVRERGVLLWDTPLEPQFHKPSRLWQPARVMEDSPDTHRSLAVVPLIPKQRPTCCRCCVFSFLAWKGLRDARSAICSRAARTNLSLIGDRRYYGESPGRPAGRSGAGMEEPGARGSTVWGAKLSSDGSAR